MRVRRRSSFVVPMLLAVTILSATTTEAVQEIAGDEPPHAHAAVFPLLEDLANGDPAMRVAAAMALRELGPVAWPAVPDLVVALGDPIVPVRKAAAGALGGIGPAAEAAVPALAGALRDPHRFVRSWAAMALFEIGPAARPATAALIELMETDSENLRSRSWAASALPAIAADPDLTMPALVRVLANDTSEEVRAVAVLSIEKHGLEAARRGGATALLGALGDSHWKVRGNAACALPKMGESATMAVVQLAAALSDETPYVRDCARRALDEIEQGSSSE